MMSLFGQCCFIEVARGEREIMKIIIRMLIVLLLAVGISPNPATAAPAAATITVNTTIDEMTANSACSLREAIYGVNNGIYTYGCTLSGSGAVTINLPAGDFLLDHTGANEDPGLTGDLDILTSMTITGVSPESTTINGNNSDRVFDILAGSTAEVTISNLTIEDGLVTTQHGGGIRNNANLTLNNVVIQDNDTYLDGGGIYHKSGAAPLSPPTGITQPAPAAIGATLMLQNSTVHGNLARGNGGGIFNAAGSNLTVDYSTIDTNQADGDLNGVGSGGGIYNGSELKFRVDHSIFYYNSAGHGNAGGIYSGLAGGDDVIITDTLFDSNQAINGYGGNLVHNGTSGTLEMYRSEIAYGRATWGAGIMSSGAGNTTYLENVTIDRNLATSGTLPGSPNQGAGVYIHSGTVEIVHATIVDNVAGDPGVPGQGAGIYTAGTGSIQSTIIARNTDREANLINCIGGLTSLGYNLSDGSSCSLTGTGDLPGTNARLGTRGLHGSLNAANTYSLRYDSPAIDAADPGDYPSTDQRGLHRPLDGDGNGSSISDIGAFEVLLKTYLPVIRK